MARDFWQQGFDLPVGYTVWFVRWRPLESTGILPGRGDIVETAPGRRFATRSSSERDVRFGISKKAAGHVNSFRTSHRVNPALRRFEYSEHW